MPFTKELKALSDAFHERGIECRWNEPMAGHTSFRIGGMATLVAWPAGQSQIITVLNLWRELGGKCPIAVLGRASNVLIPDRGFHGLIVLTTRAKRVVFAEDEAVDKDAFRLENKFTCQVFAECGASLALLSQSCAKDERGLSGLEFACGIPGTVGGATVMNAGAYGGDMQSILLASEYYDLTNGYTVTLRSEEMDLDYRHSIYLDHPEWIVLNSVMLLNYGSAPDIRARMEFNTQNRRDKQPYELPSAGSVFKRPVDNFAGRMVETVGMKGACVGGAQVSEKHAGFIVNRGGATAADVMELVHRVQDAVEALYHYRLECEIQIVDDGLDPNGPLMWD